MDHDLRERSIELGQRLAARGWTLVTAESCTGGWIAEAVTATAGSSGWFDCGFVTYSNASKQALLGVAPETLERFGAVSEQTVREMVAGALARSRADLALAVSGIAGPGGGGADKPVGTVCIGWGRRDAAVDSTTLRLGGDREAVRRAAAIQALDRLIAMARSAQG